MEIKDNNDFTVIVIDQLEKVDNSHDFLKFNFSVKLNNFQGVQELSAEFSDFEEMFLHLKKMLQSLNHIFYFQHNDERLKMKFQPDITGKINIEGTLFDEMYINSLSFSFQTEVVAMENFNKELEMFLEDRY